MSGTRLRAIVTLLRWREFQEDRAGNAFRQRTQDAEHAAQRTRQADQRVQEIRGVQDGLLEAGVLDLDRLRAVATIEDAAWQRLQAVEAEQRTADAAQSAARDLHVAARGDTRVAQTRRTRVAASEREREEKRQFDHMADLFNQGRGRAE